jgi:MATE family multidrug resistance protein
VSNELGARNIGKAKKALTVSLALSLMLGVAFLLLLGLGHDLWVRLFSSSQAVASAFASMTPLLIGSVVLDSTQGVLSGVARGCGWQHLAAWTNLVAFYVIGLPLAILFGFKLGFQTKVFVCMCSLPMNFLHLMLATNTRICQPFSSIFLSQ